MDASLAGSLANVLRARGKSLAPNDPHVVPFFFAIPRRVAIRVGYFGLLATSHVAALASSTSTDGFSRHADVYTVTLS